MLEKDVYGFVYITTNHINGKKYIGQKRYDKANKWKSYLGSGICLKRAINKYGSENFSKEIIENCKTKEYLDEREKYWIEYYNAVKSDEFYNIASGGDGGDTRAGYSEEQFRISEEFRKEQLKASLPRGEASGLSKLTEVQVLEIIKRLKNNDFTTDIANDYSVVVETISAIRNTKDHFLSFALLMNFFFFTRVHLFIKKAFTSSTLAVRLFFSIVTCKLC